MYNSCKFCRYEKMCVFEKDMKSISQLEKIYSFIEIRCKHYCNVLTNVENQPNPVSEFKQLYN